jgi:hypothetical protein
LAASKTTIQSDMLSENNTVPHHDQDGWLSKIQRLGLPEPDEQPLDINGKNITLVWRKHYVAASEAPISDETAKKLVALGFEYVSLGNPISESIPDALVTLLGGQV